jgi:hypothetical protein
MSISLKAVWLLAMAAALSVPAMADKNGNPGMGPPGSMGGGESVVITLQTSPFFNAEPACVAIQIGTNLLLDNVGEPVTPAAEVTLFVTLQGVDAVSPRMPPPTEMAEPAAPPPPIEHFCTTPGEDMLLSDLIANFTGKGGKIVACPLCWKTRYPGEMPEFGATLPTPVELHNLFLRADKVIGF